MKAPISVCIITREDPHLEACIASFRDHVEEVNVLITSEVDHESENVCRKKSANWKKFTACNVDDKIVDFSLARNESLAMATQPWVMWIDSDDIMVGAENLAAIVARSNEVDAHLFPYEYSYNEQGHVTCKHYRERLVSNKNWHFVGPVHEVLLPNEGFRPNQIRSEEVTYKHQRQFITKPQESGRNLRILKKYIEENPDDARTMYYIGLEYSNNGDRENAVKYLSKYIDVSGWDDERAMACFKLIEIAGANYADALRWAFKSMEIKSDWFEPYYHVCKLFYYQQQWQKAVDFGKLALSKGPTETLLFVNENDRYDIHSYLNVALNHVDDLAGALESCKAGLIGNPGNTDLLNNKALFEKALNVEVVPAPVELPVTDRECLEIVFVAGPACEPWSPDNLKTSGIGGSETMLIHQAKNLAALGHNVTVYAMADGTFDGVTYLHFSKYRDLSCDVLVVSRNAQFLDDSFNVSAHIRLLWCHDVSAICATSALLLKADKLLALSEWHAENLVKLHNVHPSKVMVTRNGIDLKRFSKKIERSQFKCINSSSPDRSLPVLLECWKEIKKQVPQAELHLFYGFHNWKSMAANDTLQMDLIRRLEKQIAETDGVIFHDRVSQDELAEAFQSSKAWLYPTWFTETSCISAMEAQAAGCYIVTSPIAALKETCSGYDKTAFIEGVWTDKSYQDKFIQETVRVLHEPI